MKFALHSRRTPVERRESNGSILAFDPELFPPILTVVYGENHTRTAGSAAGNTCIRRIVAARGPPILHELIECVGAARFRIRAAEQRIRAFIISGFQQAEKLLYLPFFPEIVKHKKQNS